jgi:hypothetical protein
MHKKLWIKANKCTENCARKTKAMKCTKKCALIYLLKTVLKEREVRLEGVEF